MSWKKSVTVDFSIETKGETQELQADVEVTMSGENNYGADIDGNRGEPGNFMDEFTIGEARTLDGKEVKITPKMVDAVEKCLEDMDLGFDPNDNYIEP